jgi:hypothetical protein
MVRTPLSGLACRVVVRVTRRQLPICIGCEIATAQTVSPKLEAMASISCAQCGEARKGVPKNTLYCFRCRVLLNIEFWRRRTRRCAGQHCGKHFAPLDRNDRYCSECDPGLSRYTGVCVLSTRTRSKDEIAVTHEGRYADPRLPVCVGCLRDPKKRGQLIAALEAGRKKRRQTNDWKESPDG